MHLHILSYTATLSHTHANPSSLPQSTLSNVWQRFSTHRPPPLKLSDGLIFLCKEGEWEDASKRIATNSLKKNLMEMVKYHNSRDDHHTSLSHAIIKGAPFELIESICNICKGSKSLDGKYKIWGDDQSSYVKTAGDIFDEDGCQGACMYNVPLWLACEHSNDPQVISKLLECDPEVTDLYSQGGQIILDRLIGGDKSRSNYSIIYDMIVVEVSFDHMWESKFYTAMHHKFKLMNANPTSHTKMLAELTEHQRVPSFMSRSLSGHSIFTRLSKEFVVGVMELCTYHIEWDVMGEGNKKTGWNASYKKIVKVKKDEKKNVTAEPPAPPAKKRKVAPRHPPLHRHRLRLRHRRPPTLPLH